MGRRSSHCDAGGRAALAALAAVVAGRRDVQAYYLSFSDWAADGSCPVAKLSQCLLRARSKKAFLADWGSAGSRSQDGWPYAYVGDCRHDSNLHLCGKQPCAERSARIAQRSGKSGNRETCFGSPCSWVCRRVPGWLGTAPGSSRGRVLGDQHPSGAKVS